MARCGAVSNTCLVEIIFSIYLGVCLHDLKLTPQEQHDAHRATLCCSSTLRGCALYPDVDPNMVGNVPTLGPCLGIWIDFLQWRIILEGPSLEDQENPHIKRPEILHVSPSNVEHVSNSKTAFYSDTRVSDAWIWWMLLHTLLEESEFLSQWSDTEFNAGGSKGSVSLRSFF